MRVAVCLKQIPVLSDVKFHPKTKRVIREDVASTVNPLDLLALAHALSLRDQTDGEVLVVTMGPPAAREVLEDAIRRGADRGLLLTDRRFAGADTLATVRALQRALQAEVPDLVLLGRSTLDGATAQVAPQLAELLGWPQATQAARLEPGDGGVLVHCESDEGSADVRLALPAVVSVLRGPAPPDPDPARACDEIRELGVEELGGGPRDFGTRGSPTFVKGLRDVPSRAAAPVREDVDAAVEVLGQQLAQAGTTSRAGSRDTAPHSPTRTVWALAELRPGGQLHSISFETIACARSIAVTYRARVVSVLLCAEPGDAPAALAAHGADAVLVLQDYALGRYGTASHTDALAAAIEQDSPDAVIGPWTSEGRDYLPRVAARLGLGLTGDVVALEVADPDDEEPDLLWIKPAWSGTVEAPIIAHTTPSVGTLRPGAVEALAPTPADDIAVEVRALGLGAGAEGPERGTSFDVDSAGLLVDEAPVVVSIGAGCASDLVERARELASRHGGALGGSAAAVAEGLIAPQNEIGILRRSVAPRVFLALGRHTSDELAAVSRAGFVALIDDEADGCADAPVDLALVSDPGVLVDRLLAEGSAAHA